MKFINAVVLIITMLFSGNSVGAGNKCLPSYFQEGKVYGQQYSSPFTLLEIDHQSCWVKVSYDDKVEAWILAEHLSGFSLVSK